MQQVPDLAAQRVDQRLRRVEREADQVDDGVRLQVEHRAAEGALGVLLLAVGAHLPHARPLGCVGVRGAAAPADVDHLVPGAHEARHEVGADVAAAPDDDDAHARTLPHEPGSRSMTSVPVRGRTLDRPTWRRRRG
ncbi:hypothetical protein GCM10025868_13340 [Angustibacter aerolatus]|uniref:Uncharacterized protein n=1 Tax=Angustibacter aerolatus TaxID=1162965 RepID=A0ABQ6JE52_9ACTN|nr:hypothetical protein GCM10025868_13340 [Angustibacter aerolatus]